MCNAVLALLEKEFLKSELGFGYTRALQNVQFRSS